MNRRNKSNSLPTVEIEDDDEIITNKEIDEWKWKSYHKIDVKQNMGFYFIFLLFIFRKKTWVVV